MKKSAGTITTALLVFCILTVFSIGTGCAPTPKYNVIEKTDFSITYDRREAARWARPYYDFPDRHKEHRTVITENEFKRRVNKAEPTEPPAMNRQQLRDLLLDGLNIRFMVEGINKKKLTVTTIAQKDRDNYTEKLLMFDDEHVGTFAVMLLMPKKPTLVPAIVGLHGHGDNYDAFADSYAGRELAKLGFAVIMLDFRAMEVEDIEYGATVHLATNGFNLMGMRVYEALLLVKYLQHLDQVDNTRISLLSHSGGSSTANLVVRISDDISAQVTDMYCDYMNVLEPPYPFHCEVVLALRPWEQLIRDLETLPFPSIKVPYGFDDEEIPGTRDSVLDFFVEHLYKDRKH